MEINEKLEQQFIKVLQKPPRLRTKTDEVIFERRCQLIQKQFPWQDDYMCYTMHQLVFHNYLPYYDLFKIQNVFFDIQILSSKGCFKKNRLALPDII